MFVWVSCHWHPVDDCDDYDANDDNDEDSNEIGDTNDDGSNDKLIDQSKLVVTNVCTLSKSIRLWATIGNYQLHSHDHKYFFLLMMPILY